MFSSYENVEIKYGDFYKVINNYPDNSIDILHIDIVNNGNTYEFMFQNCINKITNDGFIIMEGGSEYRDNIQWMIKYKKEKIQPIIKKYKNIYNIKTFGIFPSIIIKNKILKVINKLIL